jgi:hypothetical protein
MSRKVILSLVAACLIAALPAGADTVKKSKAKQGTSTMKTRVWTETSRLASLLQDVQTTVSLSGGSWKTVANEANALANKVYGHTSGSSAARALAKDLRMHVRELHKAAMEGDADEARRHAREALPFAYKLIDWSTPPMATT